MVDFESLNEEAQIFIEAASGVVDEFGAIEHMVFHPVYEKS